MERTEIAINVLKKRHDNGGNTKNVLDFGCRNEIEPVSAFSIYSLFLVFLISGTLISRTGHNTTKSRLDD